MGLFHSVVTKLLFIMKRSRTDLETAVVFLMTRVSKSDIDDWGELRSILRFVHCTLKEKDFWSDESITYIHMGGSIICSTP